MNLDLEVGDRVEILPCKDDTPYNKKIKVGSVGVVTDIAFGFPYPIRVAIEGEFQDYCFKEDEVKKIIEINKDKIYWSKVKPNAIIPTKLGENAGYDIYACFDGIDENYILIKPHETVMIPTGIASAFDKKWGAKLTERGSTGTKGIGQRAGLIDSGYRGEWMCPITNHSENMLVIIKETEEEFLRNEKGNIDEDIIFYPSNKAICQATFYEVPVLESEEISYDELKNIKSVRGDGKLGSSGK